MLLHRRGVFGQSMMKTLTATGGTGSMMSSNTLTADPKVGSRAAHGEEHGNKVIFTDLEAAEALAAKAPTVLFFAADWCPYCQADLKDINANGSRLGRHHDRRGGL